MADLKELNMNNIAELSSIAKALGSEIRLKIVALLFERPLNINEISEKLNIPFSTAALNVKVLEEADLIFTEIHPGNRGSMMKVCSPKIGFLSITLEKELPVSGSITSTFYQMPIGHFSSCDVKPTCGLLDDKGMIASCDDPKSFFSLDRFSAQLIWFYKGSIEYRFFNPSARNVSIENIEFSFEICSEAPFYKEIWPSDVTLSVNNREITTWTSPGDFGGKPGKYTPNWWPISNTQYGLLKKLSITNEGSYLDEKKVSSVCIGDLQLDATNYIALKIQIKDDAKNAGGINLFGEKFGNYNQPIVMRIDRKNREN